MTLPRSNLRPDEPSKINSQDYVFILDSAISKQRTQGLPSIDRRYIEAMDFFWFLSIAYEVVLLQLTQFLRSFNLITTYFLLETYCSPFFIFFAIQSLIQQFFSPSIFINYNFIIIIKNILQSGPYVSPCIITFNHLIVFPHDFLLWWRLFFILDSFHDSNHFS